MAEAGRLNGDLVRIAFTRTRPEAEMVQELLRSNGIPCLVRGLGIDGPMVGVGLLPTSEHRVEVHADQAEAARRVLSTAMVNGEEMVNAVFGDAADEAPGRKPRNYTVVGGYARAMLWSILIVGVAFGVFLLLRMT